jgi:HlyD family secretion protein
MKKLLILIVSLVVSWSGYHFLAYGPAEPPAIMQATLTEGPIVQRIQTTGSLQPLRTTPVGSQVSGVVAALYADFNSIVRKGQVIATLDRALFEAQVDLQNAAYERQLVEIANQEAQLDDATTQLARTQALFERELVTRQQLEQAALTVKTRTSSLESARRQLLTATANLDQAKLNLSYTIIKSPVDGVVISRDVDAGQTVQSSMNVAQFFTLASDLRRLQLTANVDEAEIASVRPGLPVSFTVDAYPGQRFAGTVTAVQLNALSSSNVVSYPVLIETENAELKLRPGMTAAVSIQVDTARNVLRVPNQALRFRPTADTYAALGLTPPASAPSRPAVVSTGAADRRSTREADARPASAVRNAAGPETKALDASGKIDEFFDVPPTRLTTGRVWIWDEAARTLREVPVTTGLSDGTLSQVISGELADGQQVVTGVTLPQRAASSGTAASSAVFGGGRGPGGAGGLGGGFGGPPPGGFRGPGGGG